MLKAPIPSDIQVFVSDLARKPITFIFFDEFKGHISGGGKGCIMKVFRGMKSNDESGILAFTNALAEETRPLIALQHDNVLKTYGLSNDFGYMPGLVTESYKTNILEYIKNPGLNSPKNKWDLILHILQGLVYLHDQGFVHGDIRGSNVFIKHDDSACLANYGLTQLHSTFNRDILFGRSADSARWSSPETLNGEEASERYTKESDVYSMAMTILEIFTEAQPFNDIQNDRLVVPSVVFHGKRPLLPPCLSKNAVVKDLINKCWVQDPKSRPSAVDILGIIKGVRSSIP